MVSYSTPPGYQRRAAIRRPKLDAFVSAIDQWLDDDLKVPRKQRHTAKPFDACDQTSAPVAYGHQDV